MTALTMFFIGGLCGLLIGWGKGVDWCIKTARRYKEDILADYIEDKRNAP